VYDYLMTAANRVWLSFILHRAIPVTSVEGYAREKGNPQA